MQEETLAETVADSVDIFTEYVQSGRLLGTAVVLLIAAGLFLLNKRLQKMIKRKRIEAGHTEEVVDAEFSTVKRSLLKDGFVVLIILALLQVNGVNVSSLIAGLGIASAIGGLAFQDILKDYIMGAHIISDHFYQVGDVIRLDGVEGVVISFNLRSTKIRSIETKDIVTVCNRNISSVETISTMYDIDVPLSYHYSAETIHPIMKHICSLIKDHQLIKDCSYKGIENFGTSAIEYRVRIYCKPAIRYEARRAALAIIQAELEKAGMEIPFTQLDIHVKNANEQGVRK